MNERVIPIALYLRVSSEMQKEQGTSIPAQRRELREFVATQGWEIVAEYVDEGEAAKTDDRPQFQAMIAEATSPKRPFSVIVVYALDRLFRSRYDAAVYRNRLKSAAFAFKVTQNALKIRQKVA